MDKNRRTSPRAQNTRGSRLPIAVASVLAIVVVLTLFFNPGNNNSREADKQSTSVDIQIILEGENLVIPIDEISSTAQFYPIEVNGTQMEIIVVEDSTGNIRTAFNTCQICYSSGRGYYVQDGDILVCQNCRNRFTVDQVGIESGGCNPWPISPESRTITDESISISYDCLSEATQIFSNWKS